MIGWLLEVQTDVDGGMVVARRRSVGRRGARTNGALDAFVFLLRLSKDETNDRYQSPPPAHETSPVGGGDDGHATVRYNKVGEPMCDKDGEGQLKNTY